MAMIISREFVDMENVRVPYIYDKVCLLDAHNLQNLPLDQAQIEVEFYNADHFYIYCWNINMTSKNLQIGECTNHIFQFGPISTIDIHSNA